MLSGMVFRDFQKISFSISILIACLSPSIGAANQEDHVISLGGVSFECEGCLKIDEQACARGLGASKQSVSCSNLLVFVLEQSIDSESKPLSSELFQLTLDNSYSLSTRVLAQEVLLSSGIGRDYFLKHFSDVLAEGEDEAMVLLGAIADEGMYLRLWSRERGAVESGMSNLARLKLACWAGAGNIGDIAGISSAENAYSKISSLLARAEGLGDTCPSLYGELVGATEFLRKCQTSSSDCDLSELAQLPNSTRDFLSLALLDETLRDGSVEQHQLMSLLGRIDYNRLASEDLRSRILVRLQKMTAPQEKYFLVYPNLGGFFELISFGFSEFKNYSQNSLAAMFWIWKTFISYFFIFLVSVVFFFLALRKYRRKVSSRGKTELKLLLQSMGLAENVSQFELSNRFKQLAKQVHPDVGDGGDTLEFADLNWRYERASELMAGHAGSLCLN